MQKYEHTKWQNGTMSPPGLWHQPNGMWHLCTGSSKSIRYFCSSKWLQIFSSLFATVPYCLSVAYKHSPPIITFPYGSTLVHNVPFPCLLTFLGSNREWGIGIYPILRHYVQHLKSSCFDYHQIIDSTEKSLLRTITEHPNYLPTLAYFLHPQKC